MPVIRLPSSLRSYVNGQAEVKLEGETVRLVMADLCSKYPEFRPHLFKQDGTLREYVHLFIHSQNIRNLDELETRINPDDIITLVPSIAGG
jgi:molybdopterin converting factor small subunit